MRGLVAALYVESARGIAYTHGNYGMIFVQKRGVRRIKTIQTAWNCGL